MKTATLKIDDQRYRKGVEERLKDLISDRQTRALRSQKDPPNWQGLVKRVEKHLGSQAARAMDPKSLKWVLPIMKSLLDLWKEAEDDDVFALVRELRSFEDSLEPVLTFAEEWEASKGDLDHILDGSKSLAQKLAAQVTGAIRRIPVWGDSPVTISPSLGDDWLNPTTTFHVEVGRDNATFTVFVSDSGQVQDIGDQLEGGDTDFFSSPEASMDYFNLLKELTSPGSSSKGKMRTLYTARPLKDRARYERANSLPPGVFLTNSFDDAYGLATDLGGSETRDVWKVTLSEVYLVETLSRGTVKQYQVVGKTDVPVHKMTLVEEGAPLRLAWRFLASLKQASSPQALKLIEVMASGQGKTSTVNLNILEDALKLLGWGVKETVGLAPLTSNAEYVVKPFLPAFKGLGRDFQAPNTAADDAEFRFETQEQAEEGLKTLAHVFEVFRGKAPTGSIEAGKIYVGNPEIVFEPQYMMHKWILRTVRWFLGVTSWEFTSPKGSSTVVVPSVDQRGRPQNATALKLPRFWSWSYGEGLAEDAKAHLESGGADILQKQKEEKELSIRSLENTGTCPVCFRNVKLVPSKTLISRHGWAVHSTGGWRNFGSFHSGSCPGTGFKPFELSKDGTVAYRNAVEKSIESLRQRVGELEGGQVSVVYSPDGKRKFTPEHVSFSQYLKLNLQMALQGLKEAREAVRDLDSKISEWTQRPLPGTRVGHTHLAAGLTIKPMTGSEVHALVDGDRGGIPFFDNDDFDWAIPKERRGLYMVAMLGETLVGLRKFLPGDSEKAHLNQWLTSQSMTPVSGRVFLSAYIAVHPDHRRSGIGMALNDAMLDMMRPGDVFYFGSHEPEGKLLNLKWLAARQSKINLLEGERYDAFGSYDPKAKNFWAKDLGARGMKTSSDLGSEESLGKRLADAWLKDQAVQMGRVAERALPGSKGQVSKEQGRFLVWYLPKYVDGLQTVLNGLEAAEKLYLRAGYRLPDKIPVLMAARGWGSQRSLFSNVAGGYIQIVPSAFADKANFSIFLHELAHYLHYFGVRGGFNNPTIVGQFMEMKKEKPANTGGNTLERAQDEIKAAEKEFTKVVAGIRPGMLLRVLLPNGIGFNAVETVRPVRVVEKSGRGFNTRIVMEFLEPTPEETSMGVQGNTLPLHLFAKNVDDPGLAKAFEAARDKREAAFNAYNEAIAQATDTSRYSDPRSKWFPTDYSKQDSSEWFAELVTTRLLVPSSLDPEVVEWLDTVVKTGKAPDAVSRVAARYKDKKKVETQDGDKVTIYEYSERQVQNRNKAKAEQVEKLRHTIGDLRKQVQKDIKSKDEHTKAVALAVGLMDATYERVGNDQSAKEGHFGVTGWKVKHVTFSGGKATIKYVGKSGVKHEKVIDTPASVTALKEAVKGKGDNDEIVDCDASAVNEYLKKFDITAKDIRGFHANTEMQDRLKAVRSKGGKLPEDKKEREKKLKEEFKQALAETAEAVGHEPATLKSQYLVPGLEEEFLKDGKVSESLVKKKASGGCPSCAASMPAAASFCPSCGSRQDTGRQASNGHVEARFTPWERPEDGHWVQTINTKGVEISRLWVDGATQGLYGARQIARRQARLPNVQKVVILSWANLPMETIEKESRGHWVEALGALGKEISRVWVNEAGQGLGEAREVAILQSKMPTVSRVVIRDQNNHPLQAFVRGRQVGSPRLASQLALRWLESLKTATKTHGEKEDEEAERLVRPDPKKKPPRKDLRRERMDTESERDPDISGGAERDPDLSLNYKRVARLWVRRVVAESDHAPGDVWETENGWTGMNPEGNTHTFNSKEAAQAFARGDDPAPPDGAPGPDDAPPEDPPPDEAPPPEEDPLPPPDLGSTGRALADLDKIAPDRNIAERFDELSDEGQQAAAAAMARRLRSLRSRPVTPELINEVIAASRDLDRSGLTADALGEAAAALKFAAEVLANPTKVVSLRPTNPNVAGLEKMSKDSFDRYSSLTPELRAHAFAEMTKQLDGLEVGPKRDQLQRVLDGLHLASIAEGDDSKVRQVKGLRLRPEPSGQLTALIEMQKEAGEDVSALLTADFYGPEGRTALRGQMGSMSDKALASLFAGGDRETEQMIAEAMKEATEPWQREMIRSLLGELTLDSMTVLHAAVTTQLGDAGGDEEDDESPPPGDGRRARPTTPEELDDVASEVLGRARRGAREDFTKALECITTTQGTPDEVTETCKPAFEQARKRLLSEFLKVMEGDFGVSDPADPFLVQIRTALERGLSEMDRRFRREGEGPPNP